MSESVLNYHKPSPHQKLWRYMDLQKFLWMLEKSALFFCRADLLEDQTEGRLPYGKEKFEEKIYQSLYELFEKQKALDHLGYEEIRKWMREWVRQWVYLNCWHASSFESAALWSLYGIAGQTIAIETSVQQVLDILPESAHLALVKYIDYEKFCIPENLPILPFLFKRESFHHEAEVRAIIFELPRSLNNPNQLDTSRKNSISGKEHKINLNKLITNIYVGPKTKDWHFETVQKLVIKYGIEKTVLRSPLDSVVIK